MDRQSILIGLLEQERESLYKISTDIHMEIPKEGFEQEHVLRTERVEVLEQLIKETPTGYINLRFDTPPQEEVLIGRMKGAPEIYFNSADLTDKHLYFYMNLLEKDEFNEDTRFVMVSDELWYKYFNNGNFDSEIVDRTKNNQSLLMKVYLDDATVQKIEWLNDEEMEA